MRAVLYSMLLVLCAFTLFAQQDDAIQAPPSINNVSLFNKEKSAVVAFYPGFWAPGIKLEWASSNKRFSYGTHARGYLFVMPGVKIEPFFRLYVKKNAPEGVFVQFKLSSGVYDRNMVFFSGIDCYYSVSGQQYCPGDPGYIRRSNFAYLVGGGVSAGYQFLLGKEKKFALDIFGGVQVIIPIDRFYYSQDVALWFFRGFPLEIGLRMGRAF